MSWEHFPGQSISRQRSTRWKHVPAYLMVAPSLGRIPCPVRGHKGEEEGNRCKHGASHLPDQIFPFHLKFRFVVNDVDNNFYQLVIILMAEHLTNANEQMLIRFLMCVFLNLSLQCWFILHEHKNRRGVVLVTGSSPRRHLVDSGVGHETRLNSTESKLWTASSPSLFSLY